MHAPRRRRPRSSSRRPMPPRLRRSARRRASWSSSATSSTPEFFPRGRPSSSPARSTTRWKKDRKEMRGSTVEEAGSLVAHDRLRFDYTWNHPLTDEQLRAIEASVNEKIRANLEVTKTVMPIEEAKRTGAVAMFGEKYGENVRIVAAGDYSREFCGGCHVNRTGDIGVFKIISDRSLAAGVRRMEALTGRGALQYFQSLDGTAHELQQTLNTRVEEMPALVRAMQEKQKQLDKELKQLRVKAAAQGGTSPPSPDRAESIDVDGVK